MFVDFAGDSVPVTDPETGEIWSAQVFVSVLGASGYLYVEARRRQDLASWLALASYNLRSHSGQTRRLTSRGYSSTLGSTQHFSRGGACARNNTQDVAGRRSPISVVCPTARFAPDTGLTGCRPGSGNLE
jgi:hypothetical protein